MTRQLSPDLDDEDCRELADSIGPSRYGALDRDPSGVEGAVRRRGETAWPLVTSIGVDSALLRDSASHASKRRVTG